MKMACSDLTIYRDCCCVCLDFRWPSYRLISFVCLAECLLARFSIRSPDRPLMRIFFRLCDHLLCLYDHLFVYTTVYLAIWPSAHLYGFSFDHAIVRSVIRAPSAHTPFVDIFYVSNYKRARSVHVGTESVR